MRAAASEPDDNPASESGSFNVNGPLSVTRSDGSTGAIILSRSGARKTITLSVTGYTNVTWHVDGTLVTGAPIGNADNSITLNAGNYDAWDHSVTFKGFKSGILYEQSLSFSVAE